MDGGSLRPPPTADEDRFINAHVDDAPEVIVVVDANDDAFTVDTTLGTSISTVSAPCARLQCAICGRTYMSELTLERHARLCHGRNVELVVASARLAANASGAGPPAEKRKHDEHGYSAACHAARSSRWASVPSSQCTDVDDEPADLAQCLRCGTLVLATGVDVMRRHEAAHERNDMLRHKMLAEHGQQFVARLTCRQCQFVFADDVSLRRHRRTVHEHVRHRKAQYVCKWCGFVCHSQAALNMHKASEHDIKLTRSRPPTDTRPHGDEVDAIVWTQCDMCGMRVTKPHMLLRHVTRAHRKTTFGATFRSLAGPDFEVTVHEGTVSWTCCDTTFGTGDELTSHRRTCHPVPADVVRVTLADALGRTQTVHIDDAQLAQLGLTRHTANRLVLVEDDSGNLVASVDDTDDIIDDV